MRTDPARLCAAAALGLALLFALPIVNDLLRMPVQVSDALDEIVDAQRSASWRASFKDALEDRAHFRPLRVAQTKLLLDASAGHYQATFRGFHAGLLILLVVLFARLVQTRTIADLGVAAFGLAVLTGFHTFEGMIREAYPVNHFIEVAVCCLIALNLSLARPAWYVDLAAIVTSIVAMLTLESGVLVWVVIATAWFCGLRGVSSRGTAVITTLLVAYLAVWSGHRGDQIPLFDGRSSGYWFAVLDPDELVRRFGRHPSVFYAYNVTASLASVLFGQPQDGWFGRPDVWNTPKPYLALVSNAVTTLVILWTVVRLYRAGAWQRSDLSLRLMAIAGAVVVVNAVLCFSYAKDDAISAAGVFYAIAAFLAARHALASLATSARSTRVVLAAALLVASVTWTVQAAGVHHTLSAHAFRTRNDWARLPGIWKRQGRWPADEETRRLVLQLRQDALMMPVARPGLAPAWTMAVWGD